MREKIFNKRGMTYIELIVAMSILTLIIVSFTPMLLSSYEALYQAGEDVEDTYDAKEEIESGLAHRYSNDSMKIPLTLHVNEANLFEKLHVEGKRIMSTIQEGLETIFGGGRARVDIISGNIVNDDSSYHNIILQTVGLEFNKIYINNTSKNADSLKKGEIKIDVIIPNKTVLSENAGENDANDPNKSETDELVYDAKAQRALIYEYGTPLDITSPTAVSDIKVLNITEKNDKGRIKFQVRGSSSSEPLDFTRSPLKIVVTYVNTHGRSKTTSTYLYIKPASIIFAGETNNHDYYTTSGLVWSDKSVNSSEKIGKFTFEAEGRTMRIDNSPYMSVAGRPGAPNYVGNLSSDKLINTHTDPVTINAVRWIDNDESDGIEPYYVMVGNDGRIYRMYNFTHRDSSKKSKYDDVCTVNSSDFYFSGKKPEANIVDKSFVNQEGKIIYPSLWSGDNTHIYEYSTAWRLMAYGPTYDSDFHNEIKKLDHCWATSTESGGEGNSDFDLFRPQAQFCYYSNPSAAPYAYSLKKVRPISYVLTEKGYPIRLFGAMELAEEHHRFGSKNSDKPGEGRLTEYSGFYETWDSRQGIYFYDDAITDKTYWYNNPQRLLAYVVNFSTPEVQNKCVMGPIRILSLASYPIEFGKTNNVIANYLDDATNDWYKATSIKDWVSTDGDPGSYPWQVPYMTKLADVRHGLGSDSMPADDREKTTYKGDQIGGEGTNVNLTDVLYIPTAKNGKGKGDIFYLGNVQGYARLQQTDRINSNVAWENETSEGIGLGKDKKKATTYGQGKFYRHSWGPVNESYGVYPCGALTDYLVMGSAVDSGTHVASYSSLYAQNGNDYGSNGKWLYYDHENIKKYDRTGSVEKDFWGNTKTLGSIAANDSLKGRYSALLAESKIKQNYVPTNSSNYDEKVKERTKFFFPERVRNSQSPDGINAGTWKETYLDDVTFTFGYTSNREKVYTDITYRPASTLEYPVGTDGFRVNSSEYNRSYERLYFLSHYGSYEAPGLLKDFDLTPEQIAENLKKFPHRSTAYIWGTNPSVNTWDDPATATSVVDKDSQYLNHYNNDYYNVWMPGEMYNLTKTATKDGVTVGVGYAVAGSSYQYVHDNSTWDYGITSTGLGSLYNDGVLTAMVEGVEDSFTNLLYFKDNATFDGSSLNDKTNQYKQYIDAGRPKAGDVPSELSSEFATEKGYGMHSRRSVRFTAVDLLVENTIIDSSSTSTNGKLDYYAFYGDNQGRVFKSKVATGTGEFKGDPDNPSDVTTRKVHRVPFIADTTYMGPKNSSNKPIGNLIVNGKPTTTQEEAGQMTEITFTETSSGDVKTEKTLDKVFKNIKTITVDEDIIIISGNPVNPEEGCVVVGVPKTETIKDTNGNDVVKNIKDVDGSNKYVFTKVKILNVGDINDTAIVDSYFYYVGSLNVVAGTSRGFIGCISLDLLKSVVLGRAVDSEGKEITPTNIKFAILNDPAKPYSLDKVDTSDNKRIFGLYVKDAIYSIDGHSSQ